MRLFVGVRVDGSVLAAAVEAAYHLRQRLGAALKIRWIPAANMHFTVRFIGNVDSEREPAVLEALRPALRMAPFELELGRCGAFPPAGRPRVIWIGLASGLAPLREMHEEFNQRLAPLGFEPDGRDFSAHLTLARVNDLTRTASMNVRKSVDAVRPQPARWRVDHATVFESRLSPSGAVYQALFDVPFVT